MRKYRSWIPYQIIYSRCIYAPTTGNKMLTSLLVFCAVMITFYQETDASSAHCMGCKTTPCPCRKTLMLRKVSINSKNAVLCCASFYYNLYTYVWRGFFSVNMNILYNSSFLFDIVIMLRSISNSDLFRFLLCQNTKNCTVISW